MDTSSAPSSGLASATPDERQPRRPMPTPVRVAILLLGVTLLIGLSCSLWALKQMPTLSESASDAVRYSVLASVAVQTVLIGGLMAGLVWRKNWARIAQLVLTVLSLAMQFIMPQFVALPAPPALTVFIGNVSMVANIMATYLLFSAGGRVWFRRDEPEHV